MDAADALKKMYFCSFNRIISMRNIAFLLLFLFFGHCVSAQKPAHLDAVAVTKMVPVDSIDNQNTKTNSCSGWVDTNIRFTACLNADGVVGYLLEPKDDSYLKLTLSDMDLRRCGAGLREVQRAEALFAKVIDLRVDSAQEIHRAFTAPRFYQYVRQYVFFLNPDGDTCVHINCIMREESYCPSRPGRQYVVVCDGDDDYWTADLNLTRGRLLSFHVNGPEIWLVPGRNNEPRGVYRETVFGRSAWSEKNCSFDQLPTAVQRSVLLKMDTTQISRYQCFSQKFMWGIREKKNGEQVFWRKPYKSALYYRVYVDGICWGYNKKGQRLYVAKSVHWEDSDEDEKYWSLDRKNLSHIAGVDKMLDAISQDMSARGRDFAKYGGIRWAEKLGDRYVLAVEYNPPVDADALILYYTFDRNGRMEGVTLENWW